MASNSRTRSEPGVLSKLRSRYSGRTRKVIIAGGSIALTLVVIGLISRAAHLRHISDLWTHIDKRWLAVMLIGEAMAYAGYILAYRSVAAVFGGPRLPLWMTTRIVAAGFGAMVAATSAGGLAVDYWALRRAGAMRHVSIARVLALNTLEWAVLAVGAVIASAAVLIAGSYRTVWLETAWIVVVVVCYLLAAVLSTPRRVERLWDSDGLGRVRRLYADAIGGVFICREVIRNPRRHPGALPGVAVYWAGDMVCLWAALRSIGVDLSAPHLVLGYATAYLATMVPLPVAGAGSVDAAFVYALVLVGVPLAPSLQAVVVFRVINFWLPILPALVAALGMRGLRRELPEVVHPRAERRTPQQQREFEREFEREPL